MSDNLIFDSPKLQSLKLKYASTALTLAFWVIWFYLWIPIVTIVGWWFQVETIQHEMITLGGFQAFLDVLPIFLTVSVCIAGALALWAFYNYTRFKGVDRRKHLPNVVRSDLLETFPISSADLQAVITNKVSTITIDENDKISIS